MNTHRSLLAWQACRVLIGSIYRVTEVLPPSECFGLTAQLRRAAVSAAANIAEGFARHGARETAHSLSMSLGSLAEIDTLLAVAEDRKYLTPEHLAEVERLRSRASKLTFGLQARMRSRPKSR